MASGDSVEDEAKAKASPRLYHNIVAVEHWLAGPTDGVLTGDLLAADEGTAVHLKKATAADIASGDNAGDEAKAGPKAAPERNQKGWDQRGNERPDGNQVCSVSCVLCLVSWRDTSQA